MLRAPVRADGGSFSSSQAPYRSLPRGARRGGACPSRRLGAVFGRGKPLPYIIIIIIIPALRIRLRRSATSHSSARCPHRAADTGDEGRRDAGRCGHRPLRGDFLTSPHPREARRARCPHRADDTGDERRRDAGRCGHRPLRGDFLTSPHCRAARRARCPHRAAKTAGALFLDNAP